MSTGARKTVIPDAGFSPYLDERRYAILAENARRFAAGEPLDRLVDRANWF